MVPTTVKVACQKLRFEMLTAVHGANWGSADSQLATITAWQQLEMLAAQRLDVEIERAHQFGASVADISDALGVSRQAVYDRLRRLKAKGRRQYPHGLSLFQVSSNRLKQV